MLLAIIASSSLIALIAFVGAVGFAIKSEEFEGALLSLVGFAAGVLIGGAFLHLLPEAVERSTSLNVYISLSFGFFLFFLLEKVLWRHCHNGKCELHPFAYINLIGDGIHNFIDGLVISASFLSNVQLGITTFLAVAFHEIPQEIGDFGVLVYSGLEKSKALILNFFTSLLVVFGGLTGYFLSSIIQESMVLILPFTAGGFIYIAASDLIPELHREPNQRRSLASFAVFFLGFAFMLFAKLYFQS